LGNPISYEEYVLAAPNDGIPAENKVNRYSRVYMGDEDIFV
jgi:hypothetical protein